jgi:hypothetical protein
VLDGDLSGEARRLREEKNKKYVIPKAPEEFVLTRRRRNLLDIDGQISFRAYIVVTSCHAG